MQHVSFLFTLVSFFFFISQVVEATKDGIDNLWVANTLLGLAHGMVRNTSIALVYHHCLESSLVHSPLQLGVHLLISTGGNLFSLVFGRRRDLGKHDGTNTNGHPLIAKAAPLAAPQCLLSLECYVDTVYLTAGTTFLSMLLSVSAGYRDRRKIAAL